VLDQQLKDIVVISSHGGLASSKVYNKQVVYAIIDAEYMQGVSVTIFELERLYFVMLGSRHARRPSPDLARMKSTGFQP
jgi:hypothetical protein